MFGWVVDAAAFVRVQSIFFEVTVVFHHKAAHFAFGASITYLLPCGQGLLLRYSGLSPSADREVIFFLERHEMKE